MERRAYYKSIAQSLLVLLLFVLAHSIVAAMDSHMPAPRPGVVQVMAQKMPPAQASGIKGTGPSTVGQRYQSPKHYKNHNYYTTDYKSLQGGAQHE